MYVSKYAHISFKDMYICIFPQIALAIRAPTSKVGVGDRRFLRLHAEGGVAEGVAGGCRCGGACSRMLQERCRRGCRTAGAGEVSWKVSLEGVAVVVLLKFADARRGGAVSQMLLGGVSGRMLLEDIAMVVLFADAAGEDVARGVTEGFSHCVCSRMLERCCGGRCWRVLLWWCLFADAGEVSFECLERTIENARVLSMLFGVLYNVDVYTFMYFCNFKYTYAHVIIYVCNL